MEAYTSAWRRCIVIALSSAVLVIQAKDSYQYNSDKRRPLRILFVVGKFPMVAETTILNQITGLIDLGQDVSIFAYKKGNIDIVHSDVKNYNLIERTYYRKLPRDLASYDIIYCQFGPLGAEFVKIKERRGLKAKIVTCFRGYDVSRFIKQNGAQAYKELFAYGNLFLPVCDYFRKLLIEFGCPERKIKVQHSAVDCNRFSYKRRTDPVDRVVNLITIGRLIEKKGIEYTIEAVARVLKHHSRLRYTIIGDGPLAATLEQQIERLGCNDNIKLVGLCTQAQVINYLDKAHISILSSVTALDGNEEGIPNAVKESMACGVPVIVTRVAGNEELVDDGQSGYVVEQRNVEQLVDRILYLVKHPKVWATMGASGRAKIENEFDVDLTNRQLLEIFKKLSK